MKITFVLPWRDISGGNRVIYELANRLGERGHTINIVYPLVPYYFSSRPNLKNLGRTLYHAFRNLLSRPGAGWFRVEARFVRVFWLFPVLIELFSRRLPAADAVVAASSETADFVARLCNDRGRKYYFPQHYEVWDIWNSPACWQEVGGKMGDPVSLGLAVARLSPADPTLGKFKEKIDRTYRLPLKKITTSAWLARVIEELSGEPVAGRLDLGVNFNEFFPERGPAVSPVILAPYRNIDSKGDGDVLEAFRLVRERRPDVKFILYGTRKGGAVPAWVEFRERVTGRALRQIYSAADIFVYPSWVEGYGLPPMEAMACGAACVTTNVGAVGDFVLPGKTALVVPPRAPRAIADACLSLLADDNYRRRIAAAGLEHIRRFGWERPVAEFEKLIT